jgi:hypothetical protein
LGGFSVRRGKMTQNEVNQKIAKTVSEKLAKELLKSIPIAGIVFKIAFIVADIKKELKSAADSLDPPQLIYIF